MIFRGQVDLQGQVLANVTGVQILLTASTEGLLSICLTLVESLARLVPAKLRGTEPPGTVDRA